MSKQITAANTEAIAASLSAGDSEEILNECLAALAPFAKISPQGETKAPVKWGGDESRGAEFTGEYRIRRTGRAVVITAADIERAADCCSGARSVGRKELAAAMKPFVAISEDPRIERASAAIYAFPAVDGSNVSITNAMIARLHAAYEGVC